ncbi:MAG: hypothetical protein V3U54_08700 [Thermodesulfobacteriota bacterium]
MQVVKIKHYKALDGCIYDTKKECVEADKDERLERKQSKCTHDFRTKHIKECKDVGHHDWVDYVYTVRTCKKCKYRVDNEDEIRSNTY